MQSLRHFLVHWAFATIAGLLVAVPVYGQPSMVILVRHGERAAAPSNDPILTDAGTQRAVDLSIALADATINVVVTTHLQRSQLTARPLLEAKSATHVIVRAGGPVQVHADSVAAVVRRRPAGDVVLVIGHSNTIPAIIAALGGPAMPDLCENQYSSMFILEYAAGASSPRLIKAKYGAPDPPGGETCARMR